MESIMKKIQYLPWALIAIALLAGCNTVRTNSALANAHSNYNNASANAEVTNLAALELKEANDSLYKADSALSDGDDTALVNHLAYLANQRVSIAEETAKRKSAELAVANATTERNRVRLDARTAEADAAKEQVSSMQKAADQQNKELEAASANSASDQALIAKQALELKSLNARQTKRGLVITLGDVLFGINKAQLKSGGTRNVKKLADFLKEYPQHKVLIEGYTDSTGSDSLNQDLSERRAEAVRRALVDDAGISSNRVSTRGYGKEFPVASNDTATSRQLNRRVEVIISDEKGNFAPR
jgi:outer membrane protein OmpA-like peptidoglycan-associated protein